MWKEEERREQRKVEGMGGGEVNMVRSHNILEQNCLLKPSTLCNALRSIKLIKTIKAWQCI